MFRFRGIQTLSYITNIDRAFCQSFCSDQLARLCFDGVSKYPVYVMPNLIKMIRDKADFTRVAFSMAAYRHYLKYRQMIKELLLK